MIKIINTPTSQMALTVYPGVGYPDGRDWRVTFSGTAWRTPATLNRRQRVLIRMLGNVMRATPEELQGPTFETRIGPFLADACHRLPVAIKISDRIYPLRDRTRRNGRFEETLSIPASSFEDFNASAGGVQEASFSVVSQQDQETLATGRLFLFPRNGISVISDIDDTIKDSCVGDRRELLANTFLRQFRGIEGMADVYQDWCEQGAAFHYVSSSPWQLFEALQSMSRELGFPAGTMHLRSFRLRDQLLKRLVIRRKGKATEIRKLLSSMPDRKFILVGDSGEKDPKIYARICREFPGRIKGVFIRNLAHRPLDHDHVVKLQQVLPSGICSPFFDADELRRVAGPLLGAAVSSGV